MKGSRQFTREAAQAIRRLLAETRRVAPSQQKALRQRIRDHGFFISDFDRPITGFRPEDFDELIRGGLIDII
jgi:hypothetical protein